MAAAIIPAALSLGSALFTNSAAKKERKGANAIERQRLGLATKLQGRYFDQFVPIQDRALSLATRRIDPNVEAAAAGADVENQASIQRGVGLRQLSRYGVGPDSPAATDATMRLGQGTALGRAAAMTSARRNTRGEELNNLIRVSDMGAPLLGQASAGLASVGGDRNARASDAAALQQQAWGGFGEDLAGLFSAFGKKPAPAPVP